MFSGIRNVSIKGGSFTQINKVRDTRALDWLLEAVAPNALHNSGERRDPPRCHPNTRVAVLEKLRNWTLRLDPQTMNSLVMWLYGPAGAGKSAIAQSLAEWCVEEGTLLASYFFSRFDATRNHPRSLIATIVYQAYSRFPLIREAVEASIDGNPLIFTQSLTVQIHTLIVKPFRTLIDAGYFNDPKAARVVVIDGLDECEDRQGQIEILQAISSALQRGRSPLIFLIASRPEHDIRHILAGAPLTSITTRLALDDHYKPAEDISLFLRAKFSDIKQRHPLKSYIPQNWPKQDVLDHLTSKSSGQFIYAATVARFVESPRHRPTDRLDIVLGLRTPVSDRDIPFAELDELYRHIFSSVEDVEGSLQILAFLMLRRIRLSCKAVEIEQILDLRPGDLYLSLYDLSSIVDTDTFYPRLYHASLEDFFLDRSRSKHLYIDRDQYHARFALLLFRHIRELPTSDVFRIRYFVEDFPSHIECALPTDELRTEIETLDITQCLRYTFPLHNGGSMIRSLLDTISHSRFHNAKTLHAYHQAKILEYARQQIKGYISHPELVTLIALASDGIVSRVGKDVCAPHCRLLGITEEHLLLDIHRLGILDSMKNRWSLEFYVFFIRWRASEIINFEMYAIAALHLLRYLCDPSLQPPNVRRRAHKRAVLKYKPWHYRSKRAWRAHRRHRILLRLRLHLKWQPLWIKKNSVYDVKSIEWRAFFLGLKYLPKLLELAERSEALIEVARRRTFGPMSQTLLEDSKIARNSLKRYLERVEAEEDLGVH